MADVSKREVWLGIIGGALIPLACVLFDPIVFRTNSLADGVDGAYLGAFRAFGYVAIAVASLLTVRAATAAAIHRLEVGMLHGAAVTSLLVGVVLLPVTFIGTFVMGVGLLGLTPFIASWVYFRFSRLHAKRLSAANRWQDAIAGILLFASIPLAAQWATNGAVSWAVSNVDRPAASVVLRTARVAFDSDRLVGRFLDATSATEKEGVRRAFSLMTDRSIDARVANTED